MPSGPLPCAVQGSRAQDSGKAWCLFLRFSSYGNTMKAHLACMEVEERGRCDGIGCAGALAYAARAAACPESE